MNIVQFIASISMDCEEKHSEIDYQFVASANPATIAIISKGITANARYTL